MKKKKLIAVSGGTRITWHVIRRVRKDVIHSD